VRRPVRQRREQQRCGDLVLAAENRVDRPACLVEDVLGDEGHGVPADEDIRAGPQPLHPAREIDHLGDVREVVQAEGDGVRLEPRELAVELGGGVGL
jgi:hypothetical protein